MSPPSHHQGVHVTRYLTLKQQEILSRRSDASISKALTPFQIKVYTALCRIPEGQVTSYRHLANAVQCKSFQAVGQALRRNPYAPILPCHRVVRSDGSIGGYFGHTTGTRIDDKIRTLQAEGVVIRDGKVAPSCIYTFNDE